MIACSCGATDLQQSVLCFSSVHGVTVAMTARNRGSLSRARVSVEARRRAARGHLQSKSRERRKASAMTLVGFGRKSRGGVCATAVELAEPLDNPSQLTSRGCAAVELKRAGRRTCRADVVEWTSAPTSQCIIVPRAARTRKRLRIPHRETARAEGRDATGATRTTTVQHRTDARELADLTVKQTQTSRRSELELLQLSQAHVPASMHLPHLRRPSVNFSPRASPETAIAALWP